MYVLTVDMPNLEKGMTVEIDGLGFFENGYAYDISKEQADAWRARQRTLEIDHKKDGTMVVREKEGKTLLEA
ncbi:MAG: hypothetical protein KDA17_05520, partial [Candidatus Saccharibacteria bacterium]|nr:hypothetical protein [Candidatus Saccharibacteria bacterium]